MPACNRSGKDPEPAMLHQDRAIRCSATYSTIATLPIIARSNRTE